MFKFGSEFMRTVSIKRPDAMNRSDEKLVNSGSLTMDMLHEAMRKIETAPPPPTDIRVGSILRFKEYLAESHQLIVEWPKPHGSYAGLPVYVSDVVPEDKAIIMRDHEVHCIIDLSPREPSSE